MIESRIVKGEDTERSGGNLVTRCPWHAEKTPSCVLMDGENRWHCFGCASSGLLRFDGDGVFRLEREAK